MGATRAAVANRAMSPPVSATMTSAVRRPTPGMVCSRAMMASNGAAAAAISASSSAILAALTSSPQPGPSRPSPARHQSRLRHADERRRIGGVAESVASGVPRMAVAPFV